MLRIALLIIIIGLFTCVIAEIGVRLLMKSRLVLRGFSAWIDFICHGIASSAFPKEVLGPDIQFYTFNPFYHFAARPSAELGIQDGEINAHGFRGETIAPTTDKLNTVYFAGDCTVFEGYLPQEDTFVTQCKEQLLTRNIMINTFNAGCPHYTMLHCVNRLIADITRVPIDTVVLSAGINDATSFLYHDNGYFAHDYSHMFNAIDPRPLYKQCKTPLLRNSRAWQLLLYCLHNSSLYFTKSIYSLHKKGDELARLAISKKLYTTAYFENYLRTFIGICKTHSISLVLCTMNYSIADLNQNDVRTFVASAIDTMNSIIEQYAATYQLPLLDCSEKLNHSPDYIYNKWKYTKVANEYRAHKASEVLSHLL